MRLIPAPRGAGIVAARVPKKVLQMAGIDDCYTASRGSTKTLGNFVKVGRPVTRSVPSWVHPSPSPRRRIPSCPLTIFFERSKCLQSSDFTE